MISYNTKASAYCGGLILKTNWYENYNAMVFHTQPTQEQINELEEKED
jgi:hypothetical protein